MNAFQNKSIDYRPKGALLSDLLPYEVWDEEAQVFWLRDGSASQSFAVVPKNCLGMTLDDLATLRGGIATALNQIPEGAFAQFILIRERTSSTSDTAVSHWRDSHKSSSEQEIAGARLHLFQAKESALGNDWNTGNLFQTKIYVTIRVAADYKTNAGGKTGAFSQISFLKKKVKQEKQAAVVLHELTESAQAMKTTLEAFGFTLEEVSSYERFNLIYKFLNPERSEVVPFRHDASLGKCFSDQVALTDFIEGSPSLNLGRTKIRIGTLKNLPDSSLPCLMHRVSTSSYPLALVLTVLMLPQTAERERLGRKQRITQGMAAGNRVRNLVAETQLQEIEETLSAMISSGEKLLAASFHLITFEERDTKTSTFGQILNQVEDLGAGCRWFEETVGAYPVFFGNLPFAPTFMPRPKRVLSSHLGDFLPLFGMPPGHERAEVLFQSPYQSNLGFSLFEKSPSANAILIGSTGSGKSTLACGLILGMTAGNHEDFPSAFVIDVGNSFKRTIQYLGGASIDLSPEKGSRINPFDLSSTLKTPDPEKVKFLTAFFDELLGDQGSLSKLERALLETEILLFYEKECPKTLSEFKRHLESTNNAELGRLSKLLALWCQPHPYGLLFDGETNVELTASHLHFELKGCQRYPDLLRVAMLVVMDLIWREVRTRFPKRSLIVIDEAHTVIRPSGDGRSNSAARWVDDCFRQMRKFSSAAIAISQTAKDLKNEEIGDGILANAPNRFILRQRGDEKTLREDLKLNEEELKFVFSLSQVLGSYSEFYLHSESIKSVLIYRPTSLELWLSTTHPPDLNLLEKTACLNPEWNLFQLMDFMAETYPQGAEMGRPS
jgi:hypothetical protein